MKEFIRNCLLLLLILGIFCACRQDTTNSAPVNASETKENLVKINKILLKKDEQLIRSYVKRQNLKMETTKSGLWYKIIKNGKGEITESGKKVIINYNIRLLDGTICYHSDSTGVKTFTIGTGNVEKGLEEGILFLQEGDIASFIMPPHLAHGLIGDGIRIPARAIIIYHVELLSVL